MSVSQENDKYGIIWFGVKHFYFVFTEMKMASFNETFITG